MDSTTWPLADPRLLLLNELKRIYIWQHSHAWDIFYYLLEGDKDMFEKEFIQVFNNLNENESLQVGQEFLSWVLSESEADKS
ncbi:hypothetical protein [Enterococcus sp. AZ012]|uniref:hypothetical protein n=1 Tax=unclassified Enterococcus TaxID=2608891 RepID=UPI003D2B1076